jgi:Putative DNA-binding domain
MTHAQTERWLAELQARFSAVLRTPLSAAGGTLHSDPRSYPPAAVADIAPGPRLSAAERLGAYHRQYWMRLVRVLQEQYPLAMRLCGAWDFNRLAIAFLARHPPRGVDLGSVPEGFTKFLELEIKPEGDALPREGAPPLPPAALHEAARMDAAFRHVFMAPAEPRFVISADEAHTLPARRLRSSRAFARVDEHRPLLELRARIFGSPDASPVAVPELLPRRRSWSLFRTERGIAHAALSDEQARLLELLAAQPVGDALAILESECEPSARADLPERTQRFLAQAMHQGFFSGFA